jgi:pyrimidine oxygenase
LAEELGTNIKTYAMCTLVYAESDAKAEKLADRYRDGQDMGAIINMLKSWGVPPERLSAVADQQGPFMTQTMVGSPATCREKVEEFVSYCELDGLMMIFPDFVEGLKMFGSEIMPRLQPVPA